MKNLSLKTRIAPRMLVLIIASIFHQQFKSQNNALDFDGFNDNVVINHSPSLDFSINSSFSIEAWFKTSSFTPDCIFSKMANVSPFRGYELYSEGGYISFLFIHTWTSNCIWIHTVNSFNDGQWHHVAAIYKGIPNANNVDIFVDGILQAKTITYNSLNGSTNTTNNAGIGARSNSEYFFPGSLDEVRIWNKALCGAEILNNKNCNLIGNESGLVAYYNFNQGVPNGNNLSIGSLLDQTSNGNTGILTSFALNGSNSNWVSSSANVLGTCAPTTPILPTVSISTNSNTICPGQTAILTASGANTYVWTSGQTSNVITVNPLTTTGYSVMGSNANGCTNSASITQSVSACVGLDTYSLESQVPVLVYPNPNAGDFYFKSSDDIDLKLVNELGQLVRSIKLDKSNNYEFNVNNLSSGIYYVLLTSETYNGSLKIVCFQ